MGKVLHASGSGYFTGCIQNGTGYWSLERAMDIYWRIRAWEFSISATYFFDDGDFQQGFTTYDFNTCVSIVESEEDLVCTNELDEPLGENRVIFFGNAKKSSSLYDPGFSFDTFWSDEYDFGSIDMDVQSGIPEFVPPNRVLNTKLFSIYGSNPFPISFILQPEQSQAPFFTFIDATFSLNPSEWWSYGGTYDTSTGEPL
jgi:hypothetical protein